MNAEELKRLSLFKAEDFEGAEIDWQSLGYVSADRFERFIIDLRNYNPAISPVVELCKLPANMKDRQVIGFVMQATDHTTRELRELTVAERRVVVALLLENGFRTVIQVGQVFPSADEKSKNIFSFLCEQTENFVLEYRFLRATGEILAWPLINT